MTDQAKEIAKRKIIKMAIGSTVGCAPFLLGIFVVFIAVFIVTGIFSSDISANGGVAINCEYEINGQKVSNIKVRLLNCDGSGPVEGEELIDFETYITGVVYQETGSADYEALKAQAVAARSYALKRGDAMNNALGIGLTEEDGQWILSLRSCTNDQVFCHPDKGCWSNVVGGQTRDDMTNEEWLNCTVHSGYDESKTWSRGPLPEESNIRKAVQETKGEVLLDSNGNIEYTSYTNTEQTVWNDLSVKGQDYFEILVETYGKGINIKKPICSTEYIEGTGESTGNFIHPCSSAVITSRFGAREDVGIPGVDTTYHNAIDLGAPTGTKVLATDGGIVQIAEGGCTQPGVQCNGCSGNYVIINHGNGLTSLYAHMSALHVKTNQKVSKGQLIGEVGSTGCSTGAHLHFEIRKNGTAVNPENYVKFG